MPYYNIIISSYSIRYVEESRRVLLKRYLPKASVCAAVQCSSITSADFELEVVVVALHSVGLQSYLYYSRFKESEGEYQVVE